MSTTYCGDLHDFNTKDTKEYARAPGKYSVNVKSSGGGTLRFKLEYYTGDDLEARPGDSLMGHWVTLLERDKLESGQCEERSFTLPDTPIDANLNSTSLIRATFSRGLGTKGVDYEFYLEPA